MPYYSYRFLTREDLYSLVAYLRTLAPVVKSHPPRKLDFPVNLLVRTFPRPASPAPPPNPADLVDYGRYLATVAACAECHTPFVNGAPDETRLYTGGRFFPYSGGVVASPNLTPDPETGLGHWTEEQLVTRFKMYDNEDGRDLDPEEVGFNTMMPWTLYAGMEERDLKAIYAFLRTLPPVTAAHPAPGAPSSR
jgi:mono/diheme cytochrome c family protein